MKTLKGYVIYQDHELNDFFKQPNTAVFTPVAAVKPDDLTPPIKDRVFDVNKFHQHFNRAPFNDEIADVLSHIQCWQKIADDATLDDEDFALIAESAVTFTSNYYEICKIYTTKYPYDIVKLQRQAPRAQAVNLSEGDAENIAPLVYNFPEGLDAYGASFYAMRKRVAKELIAKLQTEKPFWKKDMFSFFYPYKKIMEAKPFLSSVPAQPKPPRTTPLFSIVVPTYNVEDYLVQSLDALLAQDFDDYEIVLVNDGSLDHCTEICFDYARRYPKHIQFINQANQGVSPARNNGINIARGKYIISLDPDDYWEGTTVLSDLAKLIEQNNQPDLVINSYQSLDVNNNQRTIINAIDSIPKLNLTGDFRKDFPKLVDNYLYVNYAWAKTIKRSLFIENGLYFPIGVGSEDISWSFDLSLHVKTYCIYESGFYIYRVGRAGANTVGITVSYYDDMLNHLLHNLEKLPNIKHKLPTIYQGGVRILQNIERYANECYTVLSPENKALVEEKYQRYQTLMKPFSMKK